MRSLILAAAVVALGSVLALPAVAGAGPGGKPAFHDHGTDAGVDPDFCGTGVAINFEGRFNFVGWVGETGGDPEQVLKASFSYSFRLTNPSNGSSIVDSAAGSFTNEIVTGLESGAHTHRHVENGLRGKLKLANGRVLLHDAGKIVFDMFFDAMDNVIGIEVVEVHGPHPGFGNDLW
ncbi:MAG: hypothetical protein M3310_02880, partial [Actinomycetota bacterium]|nr:hypothetical protein [Actinomycetota bacterium]